MVSHSGGISEGNLLAMALFMTAHQIGMVFESASGIRFPALVESTTIILGKCEDTAGQTTHRTYPGFSARIGSRCTFGRRRLNDQLLKCPSVDLKYANFPPAYSRGSCSLDQTVRLTTYQVRINVPSPAP